MANFKYTDAKGQEWRVMEFRTTDADRGQTLCSVTPDGSDYRSVKNMWIPTADLEVDEDPGPTYDLSGNIETDPEPEVVEE